MIIFSPDCVVLCFNLQLYNVNSSGDPEESIYGIMFEKFPVSPKSDRKYFIMVSTLRYKYKCVSLKVTTTMYVYHQAWVK